jgi:KilA-N domain
MTSELAFQHIKGNYWYAAYGEFKVIMDKTNGYINATKMCTSGGKELCDWIKNKSSQELIQTQNPTWYWKIHIPLLIFQIYH